MKLIFILAVLLIFHYCAGARPRPPRRRPPRPRRERPFIERLSSVHKDGAAKYCTHFGADITRYTTDPFVSECKCLGPGLLSCGLGVNTIEPRHITCKQKSRTRWMLKDGCNWCYCDNGSTYCSSMKCEAKKKLDGLGKCTRTGRFLHEDGCNWCFCDKGETICTKMRCGNTKKLVSDVETCKTMPQRSFKSNDNCNWCFCMDENSPICTQKQCFFPTKQTMTKHKYKKPIKKDASKICESHKRDPGRLLHEDACNWCYCFGSKTLMCTVMFCPEPRKRRPKRSKLSNNIMEYSDRRLALSSKKTKKAKSLKEMAQSCKAGSKFKDPFGCNWCNCIEDGVVVCDQKECNGSYS